MLNDKQGRANAVEARVGANDEANGLQSDASIYDDRGMATVEYALVTVAAAGFAGLLIVMLKSSEVRDLLMGIVQRALGG